MRNYLVEVQYTGENLPTRYQIRAKDDWYALRKIYCEILCGYTSVQDYEKENGPLKLSIDDILKNIDGREDMIFFIYNCSGSYYLYELTN